MAHMIIQNVGILMKQPVKWDGKVSFWFACQDTKKSKNEQDSYDCSVACFIWDVCYHCFDE